MYFAIGEKSMIEKRYLHLTEDILKENPNVGAYEAPSLDVRHNIQVKEVVKLGEKAALKAIGEWGQPTSMITHLIVCCIAGVDMPGADYQLTKLLGLQLSVKRFMFYHLGIHISRDPSSSFFLFLIKSFIPSYMKSTHN